MRSTPHVREQRSTKHDRRDVRGEALHGPILRHHARAPPRHRDRRPCERFCGRQDRRHTQRQRNRPRGRTRPPGACRAPRDEREERKAREMSRYDYEISKQITLQDYPFYALIMAAMRQADTSNSYLLRQIFPGVADELYDRYQAPGGRLAEDPPYY